jgi:hypothetical protein
VKNFLMPEKTKRGKTVGGIREIWDIGGTKTLMVPCPPNHPNVPNSPKAPGTFYTVLLPLGE